MSKNDHRHAPPHFVQHATMMQLQQGFAIRVMGLRDQVARRQFCVADVAEGSKADIGLAPVDVRDAALDALEGILNDIGLTPR